MGLNCLFLWSYSVGLLLEEIYLSLKEEFEDPKRGNQNPYIEKGQPHNDQKKKNKRTNNDLQHITHKTNDRATRTTLKIAKSHYQCHCIYIALTRYILTLASNDIANPFYTTINVMPNGYLFIYSYKSTKHLWTDL